MRSRAQQILTAVVLCVTLITACGTSAQRGLVLRTAPTANLSINDTVEALDFALEAEHTVHLVYEVVRRSDDDRDLSHELWYERGDLGANSWSSPKLLHSGAVQQPKVALLESTLLVSYLDGPGPVILSSDDAGVSWKQLPALMPSGETAISFDLGVLGTGPVLACMGDLRDADGFMTGHEKLLFTTLGVDRPTTIVPDLEPLRVGPAPCLLVNGSNLTVVYCIVGSASSRQYESRIFVSHSTDRGRSWSTPFEVRGDRPASGVVVLKAIQTPRGPYIFVVDDTRVRGFCFKGNRTVELDNLTGSSSDRQFASYVTGGSSHERSHMTWIDTRNARTDLLSPISDQPYWMNNDAFCMRIGADGGTGRGCVQLTTTGGYVRAIGSKEMDQAVLAIWAWRPKVGRTFKAFGEKFTISYATVTPQ